MGAWNDDELRRIDASDELEMAALRKIGQLRAATPIWVVRVDDDIYDRAAYGSKYGGRHASIVDKLVEPEHRANTVRLVPREAAG